MPGTRGLRNVIESAATVLAEALAWHLDVRLYNHPECDEPEPMVGNFGPKVIGQKCPEVLEEADQAGDWLNGEF